MIKENEIGTVQIDGNRYYDQSIMRAEVETIWRKTWLLAALESDLREPKSLFPVRDR